MRSRTRWSLLLLALAVVLSACAGAPAPIRALAPGSVADGAAHNDTSTPFNLVSLPALITHRYDGRGLQVGHEISSGLGHSRYHVTYRSGDLTISGVLTVPSRRGRFPLVVLAHGYRPPAQYDGLRMLSREQAYLASRGYVVLMPDYRNFGDSDHDAAVEVAEPLGYPEDVLNAILAVRRAGLPYVDASRVAVFGRSMGGGAALNAVAARPDLVDALVLYAPVSSSAADNYEQFVPENSSLRLRVLDSYGAPESNPAFWRAASARSFLHRVDVPVQVHHGDADLICPVGWSRTTVSAMRTAGVSVDYREYAGEGHAFGEAWPRMVQGSASFIDAHV